MSGIVFVIQKAEARWMAVAMIALSARIAIGFGAFLAIAEVVRNWGDSQPWPWWVEEVGEKGTGPIESHTLTATIGVLFAITIFGFALAIIGSRRDGAGALHR